MGIAGREPAGIVGVSAPIADIAYQKGMSASRAASNSLAAVVATVLAVSAWVEGKTHEHETMPHEMPAGRVHCGHCGGIVRSMRRSFRRGIQDDIVRAANRLLRLGKDVLATSAAWAAPPVPDCGAGGDRLRDLRQNPRLS